MNALTVRDALQLAAELARTRLSDDDPQPGDLVVQTTGFGPSDPDGIGWLDYHGEAPYSPLANLNDPNVDTREVWDVVPLSGARGLGGERWQRWENADFKKVPDSLVKRLGWTPPTGLGEET